MSGAPPFGVHAPGPLAARLRALGDRLGEGKGGRLALSLLFTAMGGRARRPWDVTVFGSQRARLHPYDNLSEKRVLRSERRWDAAERRFLAERAAAGAGPFRFVDVGANAGLYTLAARAAAEAASRPFRALAIEPQPEMLDRLRVNLAASGAGSEVAVLPWAVAAEAGEARLAASAENRGTARLGGEGVVVPARPLTAALAEAGLDRIDALKIDVEGGEAAILRAFLAEAPPALRPAAAIVEADARDGEPESLAPLLAAGYRVVGRTRLNALLLAPDA